LFQQETFEILASNRSCAPATTPLHSIGVIIFSQHHFPTNPLCLIEDARFLLIPPVLKTEN